MEWHHVYSHDDHGKCTSGDLKELLFHLDGEAVEVGVKHQGEFIRRFFPVRQVLVRGGHVYAVVVTPIFNILPQKDGGLSWDSATGDVVTVYCTNGREYWAGGVSSTPTPLDWYVLSHRLYKPAGLKRGP